MSAVPTPDRIPAKAAAGAPRPKQRRKIHAGLIFAVLLSVAALGLVVWVATAYQLYTIPQNGMYPTYGSGSLVVVKRAPYASLSEVERGDVVVFAAEKDGKEYDFIWRVIGLPGDKISIKKDYVFINDKRLDRSRLRSENAPNPVGVYSETSDGKTWLIALPEPEPDPKKANMEDRTLASDELFVMGDNRHNAWDSREVGTIKLAQIKGRVAFPR